MAREKHFRNAMWGMSKSEVKDSEAASFVSEDDESLFYTGKLVGCDALIYYRFVNDELDGGAYFIDNETDVKDIQTYEKLQELMEKKYGESDEKGIDQKYPGKKMALETYGELANAVASGMASLKCIWRTDDSVIVLGCTEDPEKQNARVHVLYTNRETITEESYEDDIDNL